MTHFTERNDVQYTVKCIRILKSSVTTGNLLVGRLTLDVPFFYRAMHFSAKRGIAIACRLSVCPSVRL